MRLVSLICVCGAGRVKLGRVIELDGRLQFRSIVVTKRCELSTDALGEVQKRSTPITLTVRAQPDDKIGIGRTYLPWSQSRRFHQNLQAAKETTRNPQRMPESSPLWHVELWQDQRCFHVEMR